jgi:hypothetical protein
VAKPQGLSEMILGESIVFLQKGNNSVVVLPCYAMRFGVLVEGWHITLERFDGPDDIFAEADLVQLL